MDRLKREHFLAELNGQVFLSQFEAIQTLQSNAANDAPTV
jgi:hypothetical protein